MAVDLRGVSKHYSARFGKTTTVLKEVDVRIQVGHIYGVLGPSACGKTTLLNCILGQLKVDSGKVLVFGKPPGTPGLGVPGPRVGYMPQEVSLVPELTIIETLRYFGRLLQMPSVKIQSRIEFLLDLQHLPEKTRLVKNLSGGQQRRLSFCCALIHEPELLILDEPTVGVDPLLRKGIWEHFQHLAKETNCTIIITTHYVEEANGADMVAFMHKGRILAEDTPHSFLQTHRVSTLEDVFRCLCSSDENNQESEIRSVANVNQIWDESQIATEYNYDPIKSSCSICPNYSRLFAAFCKNLIRLWRNPMFLLLLLLLPVTIVVLCTFVFDNFNNLGISYVNDDIGLFGQLYIQHLSTDTVKLTRYSSKLTDVSVHSGDSWATVFIEKNFSSSITERFKSGIFADDMSINGSEIKIQMDMTNLQIVYILSDKFLQAYQTFSADVLKEIGLNPNIGKSPIKFSDNIYKSGYSGNASYGHFFTQGLIIFVIFLVACGVGALVLLIERKDGVWDRSWVTGLTEIELILSHFASELVLLCAQVTLVLIYIIFFPTLPCEGPIIVLILVILLQGLCGISLGFILSAISKDTIQATAFFLTAVYAHFTIGGLVWPLEAIPKWLRYIGYALPQTYAMDATRAIMSRGWSLQYQTVWLSVVIAISWIIILNILSMIVLRLRR